MRRFFSCGRCTQIVVYMFCGYIVYCIFCSPVQMQLALKDGMRLFLDKIFPSLFMFFIVSSLMFYMGIFTKAAKVLSKKIHCFSGTGLELYLLGIISGCPKSTMMIGLAYKNGDIDKQEAERLILSTAVLSPAFVFLGVGAGFFNSPAIGLLFLLSGYISAFAAGKMVFGSGKPCTEHKVRSLKTDTFSKALVRSISDGVDGVIKIGGCIVFFYVVLSSFENVGVTGFFRGLLKGMVEQSVGLGELALLYDSYPFACVAAGGFLLGFGGISLLIQCSFYFESLDVEIGKFYTGKLIQGIISGIICFIGYVFLAEYFTFCVSNTGEIYKECKTQLFFYAILCMIIYEKITFRGKHAYNKGTFGKRKRYSFRKRDRKSNCTGKGSSSGSTG